MVIVKVWAGEIISDDMTMSFLATRLYWLLLPTLYLLGTSVAMAAVSAEQAIQYIEGLGPTTAQFVERFNSRVRPGKLYLDGSRFRFQYDDGETLISDGRSMFVLNRGVLHTHLPLSSTPAIVLAEPRRLREDRFQVQEFQLGARDGLQVIDRRGDMQGALSLFFSRPLAIAGWAVQNGTGPTIEISLSHLRHEPIDPALFTFREDRSRQDKGGN